MMKKVILFFVFMMTMGLIVSCGDDAPRCGDWEVNGDEVCDVGGYYLGEYISYSGINCHTLDYNFDDLYYSYAKCKSDCSGWDTSECSTCGDGNTTGEEECDGDVKSCTFLSDNVSPYDYGYSFISGTAYCKSECEGWNTSECVYKACPDGGQPSSNWVGITGEHVCLCSPQCEIDEDCNIEGEICLYSSYCVTDDDNEEYRSSSNATSCSE